MVECGECVGSRSTATNCAKLASTVHFFSLINQLAQVTGMVTDTKSESLAANLDQNRETGAQFVLCMELKWIC